MSPRAGSNNTTPGADRPPAPARIRTSVSAGQALAQEVQAAGHIAQAARLAAHFPLDDQRTLIADKFQCLDEAANVHLTFAKGHLFTPAAFLLGPARVLDVHGTDARAQQLDG